MASSKKGISAHQLHRTLGITYKSAWFMAHRIREAMNESGGSPVGGKDVIVEADETYLGSGGYEFHNEKGWKKKRARGDRMVVVSLVERNGRARSVKVDNLTAKTMRKAVLDNASTDSTLMTDEAKYYPNIGKKFAAHARVNHMKGEYVRGAVSTNTVEGFFSIFKRGMIGTYQHCGEQHLQRYLNEFDFRYSNRVALGVDDAERTMRAIKGAEGKRLTYRRANGKAA